ncbi:histidine kinase/DNA gyrase B/HSP90-like ATPase [Ruminiclostridium sufflavum DSM 19573]|uniref:histidine kinase n=1 Tax=Ruminiclostridium sufflavum DSM 19573 TaxID=1121337 RepID=A0A318XJR1_9FIRM|nr:7TM diverse intracellular signaling domain-containing protein [Ruminiclostridium sufflavum]PYG87464.1 histidine kinase/DNA gyrase B/HSP90-like ATPase [Ruminiclostridium sufflavum DSM 19573]
MFSESDKEYSFAGMGKRLVDIVIIAFVMFASAAVFLFFGYQNSEPEKQPQAVNGIIDLSAWDFKRYGPVKLDGQWELYWNKLLNPDRLGKGSPYGKPLFVQVPGLWKNIKTVDNIKNEGFATYRLLVRTGGIHESMAINIKFLISSCRIWIGDRVVYEAGHTGTNAGDFRGGFNPQIIDIQPDNKDFYVTVQISNYGYANGGFAANIELGDTIMLVSRKNIRSFGDMFLFGCIMIMALYHLTLFILRKKEIYTLYFGIMCLLISVRTLLMGEMLLYNFMPDIPLYFLLKVSGVIFPLILPCFVMFTHSFFPEDTPVWFVRVSQATGLLFTLITMVLQNDARHFFLFPFQVCSILVVILLLAILTKASYMRRDGALVFLIATAAITLIILNDIFNGYGILKTGYYIPLGQLLFIFVQSFMLFRKLVSQEELILKSELRMLQAQIKPHFLFNALNTIISVSRTSSEKAVELLLYLSDYLRCGFSFKNDEEFVDFETEMLHVKSYLEIEKARFSDKLKVIIDVGSDIACKVPACIIQPIVENAVLHGILPRKAGGTVKLSAKQRDNMLFISVEDDGVGMTEEKLNSILGEAQKSSGIGLKNVKNRIQKIYKRKIEIQSTEEKGTVVRITLPLGRRRAEGRESNTCR